MHVFKENVTFFLPLQILKTLVKIKLENYLCTLNPFLCTPFYQKQPIFLIFWVQRELIHSLVYKIRLLALNNLWSGFVRLGLSYNFPYMHPIYPTFHNSLFYHFSYNTSDTCSPGNAHHCSSLHSRHHSWKNLGKLLIRTYIQCRAVGGRNRQRFFEQV